MNIKPYVYRCTHKETGRFYFGCRIRNTLPAREDLPVYRTSNKIIRNSFEEYDWEILFEDDDYELMYAVEQCLIGDHRKDELIINRRYDPNYLWLLTITEEFRTKISKALIGNKNAVGAIRSEETRAKISATLTGTKLTEEHKANISKSTKGKKKSEQHKENMKDRVWSEESRKKLHDANVGKTISPEQRAKISATLKERNKNKKE